MATGFIGTSSVPFFATHLNNTGSTQRVTVSGSTLSYTCPAAGVRYAVLTIDVSLTILSLPAAGANGSDPRVFADIYVNNMPGSMTNTVKLILAPGQVWSGTASSSVSLLTSTSVTPSTNAVLRASVLEVV